MTHGRKKFKKRRVWTPKPIEEQPAFDSKEIVCFLTYSVGCIALQKLTFEIEDLWNANGAKFVCFDQSTFHDVLTKYQWKTVVLHRGGTHNWKNEHTQQLMTLLKHQKEQGARLVYYIDDFLVHMNNNTPLHLMEMCDTVIAKGYFLPDYLIRSEGIKNVVPLKTWINLTKFDDQAIKPATYKDPFSIFWFSAGRTGLGFLPQVFERLNPDDWKDTGWSIVGSGAAMYRAKLNKYRGFKKYYSEKIDIKQLWSMIKGCDILINPLHPETDNISLVQQPAHKVFFNNAKVEIKYILAGAARKPLVTCASRCYEECIKPGKNGYISDNPDVWVDVLKKLKGSKNIRSRIGNAARKDIEANYDAKDRWPTIIKYIEG